MWTLGQAAAAAAAASAPVVGACAAAALQGELRIQLARHGGRVVAAAVSRTHVRRAAFLSAAAPGADSGVLGGNARLGIAMVGAAAITVGLELEREASVAHARSALELEPDRLQLQQSAAKQSAPRWQLFDQIGAGAFGTVRLGMHEESGEVAAVKVVEPARFNYAALQREISALQLVKALGGHRSIVDLKDVYMDGSKVYLVTELARGGELFEAIVARGALGEGRAGAIAHEIASALAFMHAHGLVHKDVKPENILLMARDDKDEERQSSGGSLVKLADFGSAGPASATHTRVDDIGTSAYLPPELLAKGVCTSACDMWALGCVLYIMLSGAHPFDLDGSASDAVVERRVKNEPVTFDVAAWQGVSPDAKDLVTKLLHKDPARRLTADQVLQHPWIVASARAHSVAHMPVMATSPAAVEAKAV